MNQSRGYIHTFVCVMLTFVVPGSKLLSVSIAV